MKSYIKEFPYNLIHDIGIPLCEKPDASGSKLMYFDIESFLPRDIISADVNFDEMEPKVITLHKQKSGSGFQLQVTHDMLPGVEYVIARLTPIEQALIDKRYRQNLTLLQAARELGVSVLALYDTFSITCLKLRQPALAKYILYPCRILSASDTSSSMYQPTPLIGITPEECLFYQTALDIPLDIFGSSFIDSATVEAMSQNGIHTLRDLLNMNHVLDIGFFRDIKQPAALQAWNTLRGLGILKFSDITGKYSLNLSYYNALKSRKDALLSVQKVRVTDLKLTASAVSALHASGIYTLRDIYDYGLMKVRYTGISDSSYAVLCKRILECQYHAVDWFYYDRIMQLNMLS